MCLNHPALVPKHPTHQHRASKVCRVLMHLAISVMVWFV